MKKHLNHLFYNDQINMRVVLLTFLVLITSSCTPFSRLRAAELVVVAFGDSTTAPRGELKVYADLLQRELIGRKLDAKVINAGVGGNTTRRAMSRFETDVLAKKPDIVIIQFGINDAAVDVWKTPPAVKPRVSLQEYEANLRNFIRQLKRKEIQVVLMTPNCLRWTPSLKKLYGKSPYLPDEKSGFNVLLVQYAKVVQRIGREELIPVVDVYTAFEKYGKQKGRSVDDLLLDGMHPNNKGQQIVFELLKASPPFKMSSTSGEIR